MSSLEKVSPDINPRFLSHKESHLFHFLLRFFSGLWLPWYGKSSILSISLWFFFLWSLHLPSDHSFITARFVNKSPLRWGTRIRFFLTFLVSQLFQIFRVCSGFHYFRSFFVRSVTSSWIFAWDLTAKLVLEVLEFLFIAFVIFFLPILAFVCVLLLFRSHCVLFWRILFQFCLLLCLMCKACVASRVCGF